MPARSCPITTGSLSFENRTLKPKAAKIVIPIVRRRSNSELDANIPPVAHVERFTEARSQFSALNPEPTTLGFNH